MKNTQFFLFFIALVLFACSIDKPSKEANEHFAAKGIDSTQAALIFNNTIGFQNNTQVSIALITDSGTYFVGVVCRNDTIISVQNHDAHFEIGSLSKMMTATLLSDFVLRDSLSLTDSISKFLPFQLRDSIEITFGELANNTSGLPKVPTGMLISSLLNMNNPYKNFDDNALEAYLKKDVELSSQPGTTMSNSNLGYGLLGYTLAIVGKKSYSELVTERVFKPYNLSNTTVERDSVKNSLIPGLNAAGKVTSNWDMAAMAGAGAVLSTAEDLALFAKAQCDTTDSVLALTRNVEIQGNEEVFNGLGWKIISNEGVDNWYAQNGATGGYTSSFVIDPSGCKAVVILSNVSGSSEYTGRIEQLSIQLMQSLYK